MPSLSVLPLFVATTLVLQLVPGPSVLYITARAAAQGRRAGLVSVLGVNTGTLVHVGAAVVGISALLVTSSAAFSVVKLAGAGYLVYLGLRTMLRPAAAEGGSEAEPRRLRRLYVDGVMINLLNPKTALFFLALLPQFVDRASGPVWTQTLVLGLVVAALGTVIEGTYALVSARVGDWLRRRGEGRERRRSRFLEGGLLVGLGVSSLALPQQRPD